MLRSLRWKLILYAAITIFAILLLLPTVISQLPPWFTKVIPTEKIHLGLDLQGGMYLLLTVEGDKAVESYAEQIANSLRDELKEKGVPVGKLERWIISSPSGLPCCVNSRHPEREGYGRSSWSLIAKKPIM
jgi:preprotein translocase subunit SecD